MAANPQMITNSITINYDGVNSAANGFGGYTGYHLQRGTVIDVPVGSALATAIGAGNMTPLTSQQTADMGGISTGPEAQDTVDEGGGQF
jgi:hypothetical protein